VKLKEAVTLIGDLYEVAAIVNQAGTGDGRWNLLQTWLQSRPKWKTNVERWAKETPEQAYISLKAYVCEQAEIPSLMLNQFLSIEIEGKARGAISVIQELYRERAEMKSKGELKQ
jgi:hypothetical protein